MTALRWIGLSIGIVMILAAFGLVVWQEQSLAKNPNVAFAQADATATPVPNTNATPGPNATPKAQQPSKRAIGEDFWNRLAAKLGLKPEDLKARAIEARKEMLDQAVKDGRITQAQADALKQKLDANGLIAPIHIGRGLHAPSGRVLPRKGIGGPFGLETLEAVAKALKLTPADLTAQLRSGKTLAEIAKAQNVDEAVVKQAIIDSYKAQIDRRVQDGLLTQAQADQLKSRLTPGNIDLNRFRGFHRGRR